MPRIDPLLTAMVANRGEAISLADGEVAHIVRHGVSHPLTRQPLPPGQLVLLLREMTSADVAARIGQSDAVDFTYSNGEGEFVAEVRRENGTLRATVRQAPQQAQPSIPHAAVSMPAPSAVQSDGSGFKGNGGNGGNGNKGNNGNVDHGNNSNGDHGNGLNGNRQNAHGLNGHAGGPDLRVAASTPAAQVSTRAHPLADQFTAARNGEPAATEETSSVRHSRVSTVPARAPDAKARLDMDALLSELVNAGGSDLHLRVGEPPILRIHGELKRLEREPVTGDKLEAMLVSIMPGRNLDEYRETADTDFAHEIEGVARFRANAFRDHHGAGGVFRVIPDKVATVEGLGITPEVQNLCYLTKGLVLVTGPTGSGKSTTLGALVDLVNRSRDDHVITIEDPIEFVHKNKRCVITQRQVGLHTGSFKAALRAALREDPDVVLIGELRDLETISIALETAETGHLVFGTLHTTTAVGTIDRVIDQFPADRQAQIRVMLADTLKGVISQTLCKKIGGGRVAVREILLSVPAVSNLIREGKAFQIPSVMQTSRKLGMILLNDVLIDLVDQNQIEPQEAYMKATDKTAFLTMLRNRGHETNFISS